MKSVYSLILLALVAVGLGFSFWVGQGPELQRTEDSSTSVIQNNQRPIVVIGINPNEAAHREFVKQWIELSKNQDAPVESIIAQTSVASQLEDLGRLDSFEPQRDNYGVHAALKKVVASKPGSVLVLTDQVQALSVSQSSLTSLFSKEELNFVLRLIVLSPEPIKDSLLQRVTCPDEKLTECMTKRSQLLAQLRTKEVPAGGLWSQWSPEEKTLLLSRF